jgi:Tfp pilus assembly protein PilO
MAGDTMMRRLIVKLQSKMSSQSQQVAFPVRLNWMVRRWLPSLGWPGMLAIALLVMLVPFYFSAIHTAQTRLTTAQHESVTVREKILQANQVITAHQGTVDEQLAEYYRAFPNELESPEWLGKMAQIAEKAGLKLNEGEYKTSKDKVGRLMHFQITLPVTGSYPQIREFIANVPVEMPIMALENVQLERKTVSDAVVNAKIVFGLYLEQVQ